MARVVTLAFIVLGLLLACGGVDKWDPTFPNTPNAYGPCGAVWVSCRPKSDTCCPQGMACIADGLCEDIGNTLDFGGARSDAGVGGETYICRGSRDRTNVPRCHRLIDATPEGKIP